MKEQFIQISDYIESLEQRLAALEARVSIAETAALEQASLVQSLAQRILELEERPIIETDNTPQENEEEVIENEVLPIVDEPIVDEPVSDVLVADENTSNDEQPALEEEAPIVEEEPIAVAEEEPAVVVEESPIATEESPTPLAEEETPIAAVDETPIDTPETLPVDTPKDEKKTGWMPMQTNLFGGATPIATTIAKATPVQDIRKAISLGDRFLFQRVLFDGSAEKMQKTLDAINGMSGLKEAEDYVNANFHWDKENSAYELFMNVLKRRF